MNLNGKDKVTQNGIEATIPKPMHQNELTEEEKIRQIQEHFTKIMQVLGLDINDSSLKETPHRIAKMYVKEIFSGLNPRNFPKITLFDNTYGYHEMLIEKDITLYSYCEHHFVPIIGKVHIGYFPQDKVIGLSKINRLVKFWASRPQVQEKLTMEIATSLKSVLNTEDVAVYIEADHLCVASRGIKDISSLTKTGYYGGKFKEPSIKQEFLNGI
ncbi:MAG: GTP cyclohydrolase 1 [Saprospiraceae bacterium]|nr:MAG: GTP cyclohydrolase 1 [Saprospiraceae bacterium]